MNTRIKLPAAALLLTTPFAAYAEGAPHIVFYSFGGGFAGGLLGALLACWLCKRFCGPKNDRDSTK